MFNTIGDRFNFSNTAIVITDGQSNVDTPLTLIEAAELKGYADVIVVGVTNDIKIEELRVGRTNVFDGWTVDTGLI